MAIDTKLIQPMAEKFNLSLTAFGNVISDPYVPYYGSAVLSNPRGSQLEPPPPPTSPYKDSTAYKILSGTIKSVYSAHRGLKGNDDIKVYPGYISGNTGTTDFNRRPPVTSRAPTDTEHYWKLSENIYRYNHVNGVKTNIVRTIHTVNERKLISLGWSLPTLNRDGCRSTLGRVPRDDRVLHRSHPQRR